MYTMISKFQKRDWYASREGENQSVSVHYGNLGEPNEGFVIWNFVGM